MSAPVDLSGLQRYTADCGESGPFHEPCHDGEAYLVADVRALLAAAPAPAAPTASADTKDFERLANKWFSSRFISTAELGKAWAEMAAHIDAHTARAVAAKQAEIDHLKFELHEATNSIVARMAAPQQHAQAGLSDEQARYMVDVVCGVISKWPAISDMDEQSTEKMCDAMKRAILAASHQPAAAPATYILGDKADATYTPPATKQCGELPQDERAAFEAWGKNTFNYGFKPETWLVNASEYGHEETQMAYEGWQARAVLTQRAASVPAQPLTSMGEDGDQWYFDCDGHYIDVKRDEDGKYSIFFRNRKDGSEGWYDQADIASVPAKELFAEKLAREMREGTAVFVSAIDVPAASVPDAGRDRGSNGKD